ncbi:MAG: rhomboid family intramembrane serine protease [Proteobacteria bacterium]|nr:rhomboid family intramembrane serine protease [Pseudomonadota bacterium]
MLQELALALQAIVQSIQDNYLLLLWIAIVLWLVLLINKLMGYRLNFLGIVPRTASGLIGILFAPLLHASANHLFFNIIPLLALAGFILIAGTTLFWKVTVCIILFSGILTWLLGRRAIHIGASALVTGYWGYLLFNAYRHPSMMAFILAIICVYYFGGIFLGLFPSEERVSWEGHLFGFVAGIATNYLLPMIPN